MIITQGSATEIDYPDGYFDIIVTSPPYWKNRVYGDSGEELGTEATLAEYLAKMRFVLRECSRVLSDDGVMWWNHGDTASGSGGAGGDYGSNGKYSNRPKYGAGKSGMAPQQWCNVPAKISIIAQEEFGFRLRNEIIWNKTIPRPESMRHVKRHLLQHEKIFMFSKGMKYHFNPDAAKEKGNVWSFLPETEKAHFAPFPDELVQRCLEVTGFVGAKVLDPFSGSHTTARVAESMGMEGYGIELYHDGKLV